MWPFDRTLRPDQQNPTSRWSQNLDGTWSPARNLPGAIGTAHPDSGSGGGGDAGPGVIISDTAPANPTDGLIWVQPVDPIVDLFSPNALTDASLWTWASFGYAYPGGPITVEPEGIKTMWNPNPGSDVDGRQLAVGPLITAPIPGHRMLAQATIWVPAGAPDVRLTHAYTSSSPYTSVKEVDVTLTIQFPWVDGQVWIFGPESTPAPKVGYALVKDIHLYDLSASPPSPMWVWQASENRWLSINEGLVQRAGDTMVGPLRFAPIDVAFGQPTVTDLPTPVELSDAVPLGFLLDTLDTQGTAYVATIGDEMTGSLQFIQDPLSPAATVTGLPDPVADSDAVPLQYLRAVIDALPDDGDGGAGSLVIVSPTPPASPAIGQQWYDTSTPDVAPFIVEVSDSLRAQYISMGVGWLPGPWKSWVIEVPCDGVITSDIWGRIRNVTADTVVMLGLYCISTGGAFVVQKWSTTDHQQARSVGVLNTQSGEGAVGIGTFIVTGVPPEGAKLTFQFQVYSGNANGSALLYPYARMRFDPYMNERITSLELG